MAERNIVARVAFKIEKALHKRKECIFMKEYSEMAKQDRFLSQNMPFFYLTAELSSLEKIKCTPGQRYLLSIVLMIY